MSAHPTFLTYVPPTRAQSAFFSLKGEQSDYYYQVTLSLPASGGILSVALPAEAPDLEVGQSYQWALVLICGEHLRPGDPRIGGWVQRIEPDPVLASQVATANGLERVTLYGTAGLWFDTLAALLELRQLHPTDQTFIRTWEELLADNGLGAIASVPLIAPSLE